MKLLSFFRPGTTDRLSAVRGLVILTLSTVLLTGAVWAQKPTSAEKLVDFARLQYGTYTFQKNGTIKSNLKLGTGTNVRDARSTLKFLRKPKLAEDLVILELELPDSRFTMGFDGENTWAKNNGEKTELSADLSEAFRASYLHSFEALLRYKEDGSKITYIETKKIASLEVDILDLTMANGMKTRYEVSRRSGHVLSLEYETKPASPDAKPVKYRLNFRDFKVVQNTIILPYKTVVFENDVQVEERTIIEASFNGQLEDKNFKADPPPDKPEAKPEEKPADKPSPTY